jgi:Domain of unknown function (DUF5664)
MLPTDDKARKELPYWTFLTGYFLDAWMAVANVAFVGNKQHNPGQPLHWAREKSTDQMNTAFRHQLDYAKGIKKDTDGQWHLAKAIWRLSAQLQLDIEADAKVNLINSIGSQPEAAYGEIDDKNAQRDTGKEFRTTGSPLSNRGQIACPECVGAGIGQWNSSREG